MIVLAIIICVMVMPISPALAKHPAAKHHQSQHQSAHAIYLSPGPKTGVPWGGYHITVTSFSKNHAPGKSEKQEARKAWNKVHGPGAYSLSNKHQGKDYWAHDLGNGYGICFKSGKLDKLTSELHKHKFDNQKELSMVNGGHSCRWHVSLYAKTPEEAYKKFDKLKDKPWKLYDVKYPGSVWEPIN